MAIINYIFSLHNKCQMFYNKSSKTKAKLMLCLQRLIIFFPLLFLIACSINNADIGNRYGLKSGIVTYSTSEMADISTIKRLYFEDYGEKECIETITQGTIIGIKTKKHSFSIMDGDYVIEYDIENTTNGTNNLEKIAIRKKHPNNPLLNFNLANMDEETKIKMNFKEEGEEKVAGVKGKKYSIKINKDSPERIYGVIYKNINLKIEIGQINMIASKIEKNIDIPDSIFTIPSDYELIDLSSN